MSNNNINPIEFLKEEMENDEVFVRINSIHRLQVVAQLIGPDGIKNQLLPYLDQLIKKEDDEVLFAIAEELGNLGQYLPNQQSILLSQLEYLASFEETVVRDMACKSLQKISRLLNDQETINLYIPLTLRLASDANNLMSRISSINLMTHAYPRGGDKKASLRQKFFELCSEDTPMIRRTVALKIGELATLMEKDIVKTELLAQFKQLAKDEQDSVRELCLNSLKELAKVFTKEENIANTIQILIEAFDDKSWRVRLALAQNFPDIANAFGKDIFDQSLIQTFINLLKDPEYEVKITAINSLSHIIENIKSDKYQLIIPHIQNLCNDSNKQVKSGVANIISNLFSQVKKDPQLSKLLPNIIDFQNDENQDVRIGGIKASIKYIQVYGVEALNAFIPHLKNSIQDTKWRVRSETLNAVVNLSCFFENYDIFQKQLEPLFFIYLKDKNSCIREQGVQRLKDLILVYKQEWVNQSLLAKLNESLSKDQSYLIKITGLYSLQQIALNLPSDYVNDKISPILLKHAKDVVPNIRFVVCKIFMSYNKQLLNNNIIQALQELSNDTDKDVKIFAQQALANLN